MQKGHGILSQGRPAAPPPCRIEAGEVLSAQTEVSMFLSLDKWLLPAIAAASSSYLVCLGWERFRTTTAPSGLISAFLAGLSFVMGAFSAYYRDMPVLPDAGKQYHHHVCGGGQYHLFLAAPPQIPAARTETPESNLTPVRRHRTLLLFNSVHIGRTTPVCVIIHGVYSKDRGLSARWRAGHCATGGPLTRFVKTERFSAWNSVPRA